MFRTVADFVSIWESERGKTLDVLRAVPSAKLGEPAGTSGRTLGRIAWHLVESCVELPARVGLPVDGPSIGPSGFISAPVPATSEEIVAAYEKASVGIAAGVCNWIDADLDTEDDMYGERWRRGFSLWVLVVHQVHHRGQMTVLMREAGLRPPDLYGPAKESWAAYGAEPPAV